MPGFEQNWGTNLKLKSASRLEIEISEILNRGNAQYVKQCSTNHFLWLLESMSHRTLPVFCRN